MSLLPNNTIKATESEVSSPGEYIEYLRSRAYNVDVYHYSNGNYYFYSLDHFLRGIS